MWRVNDRLETRRTSPHESTSVAKRVSDLLARSCGLFRRSRKRATKYQRTPTADTSPTRRPLSVDKYSKFRNPPNIVLDSCILSVPQQIKEVIPMATITTKDGTEIYYKDWGSGQPIVFSHGWPLSADDWDTQMMFFLNHGYASSPMTGEATDARANPATGTI
jgi:hypothetical protein